MKDKIDILKSEVEISDVVMSATNETFAKILEEGKQKENEKILTMPAPRKRGGFKKRWIAVAAVAVLAVGTLSVGAEKGAWNFGLVNFSGISTKNIEALDGSQSEVGTSTTATLMDYSKNPDGEEVAVTFTVTDSFGDSQQQFLEITTDYTVSDSFNPEQDVITTKSMYWDAKDAAGEENSGGGTYDEKIIVRDGMLVMQIYIREDAMPINKADMTLYFEDLYLCKDVSLDINGELSRDYREGNILLGGSWELAWQNDYETDTNDATCEQVVVIGGMEIQVDKVSVSKLGIRWEGHSIKGELTEAEMDAIGDEMWADYPYEAEDTVTITYNDGTTYQVEHPSSAGVTKNGNVEYYISVTSEDVVLEPAKVKSITFHDVEIMVQ